MSLSGTMSEPLRGGPRLALHIIGVPEGISSRVLEAITAAALRAGADIGRDLPSPQGRVYLSLSGDTERPVTALRSLMEDGEQHLPSLYLFTRNRPEVSDLAGSILMDDQGTTWEWRLVDTRSKRVAAQTAQMVEQWITEAFGPRRRVSADGQARAAVEDLVGYVAALLDNTHLKRLVADLKAELAQAQSQLSDQIVQSKTFMALYEQMKLDNDALKLELSKGRLIDRNTSGRRVKLLSMTGALLLAAVSGFLGDFASNELDRALHDPDADELRSAESELPARCNQTIVVLEAGSLDEGATTHMHDDGED